MKKNKSVSEIMGEVFSLILTIIGSFIFIIKWYFIICFWLLGLIIGVISLFWGDKSYAHYIKPLPIKRYNTAKKRMDETKKVKENIQVKTTNKILEELEDLKPSSSNEYQVIQKLRSSPGMLVSNILSEEEMEILLLMILKSLGFV